MYFLYLDSKCDNMVTDFHQYSGFSIGVYWCGDKNDRNKKILFACVWDTRDPKNIFFIQAHKRGLSGRAEGNIEEGLQLQSSFSAECSGGEKKTWKSQRNKNNNYCQYKLQHGSMLRISAGCFHSGTCGGKKRNPSCATSTRVRDNISCFLLRHSATCFFPILLWHPINLHPLQTGVNLVIYHSYPRVWLHCDQSYRWIIARPFDRDASFCRHWCKRKGKYKKNERADELSVPIKWKFFILGDLFASLFFLDFWNKLAI